MCKNAGKIFILVSKVANIYWGIFLTTKQRKKKKHEIEHIFDPQRISDDEIVTVSACFISTGAGASLMIR